MASPNSFDFSKGPDFEWRGFTLYSQPNGRIVIFSPTGVPLLESAESPLRTNRTRPDPSGLNAVVGDVPSHEIFTTKVYARCCHMWDPEKFLPNAPNPEGSDLNLYQQIAGYMKDGEYCVDATFVGYDMLLKGLVFLRKANENGQHNVSDFNLNGNEFRLEPRGLSVGMYFVPAIGITSAANLVILKRWTNGESASRLFLSNRRSMSNKARVDEIKRHCQFAAQSLSEGRFPMAVVHEPFHDPTGELRGGDPGYVLRHPDAPHSLPENPSRRDLTADATLLHRERSQPSGFVYRAPLIEALIYPEELLEVLRQFASRYPFDILVMRNMKLALHLWADIINDKDYQLEPAFTDSCTNETILDPITRISLAKFLVYYSHLIKWPRAMKLAEFLHPFRFVKKASATDVSYLGQDLIVNDDDIDEDRVLELMTHITSSCPTVGVNDRVTIYPCMLPGTDIPALSRLRCPYPNRIEIALTGLENVEFMGLPRYVQRPDAPDRAIMAKIMIPASLNDLLQNPLTEPVDFEGTQIFKRRPVFPAWKAQPTLTTYPILALPDPKPQSQMDYDDYHLLIKKLSTIPRHEHIAWRKAFDDIKAIPQGQRNVQTLRDILRKAKQDEVQDMATLEDWLNDIEDTRRLPDEDINWTIPAVVCAIIGIQAPKERDKLDMLPSMLPLIAASATGIATTLPALLALCRSTKLYPAQRGTLIPFAAKLCKDMRTHLKDLRDKDWFAGWGDF
ncbi:hypothetical protein J3E69DRAFT_99299 [Trichoderma sp. SZMC 28015]